MGGLAAAITLRRKGFAVDIYDRAPEPREIEAGVTLWPNATGLFNKWGLLDAALEQGCALRSIELRSWNGKMLTSSEAIGKYRFPTLCMHRAGLIALLRGAIPRDRFHGSATFDHFDLDQESPIVHFEEGTSAKADAWVGADGLHSKVRSQIHGKRAPHFRGYQRYRGIANGDHSSVREKAFESWGYGKRFGACPIGHGRIAWYATINARPGTLGDPRIWKAELQDRYSNWHNPIPLLIQSTPDAAISKDEIYDREPLFEWGRGCVTLLGDAAHPMTPNLGQGECMTLEDADCLSESLANNLEIAECLRTYEFFRYERTRFMTLDSRRLGEMGQWVHPLAVLIRNLWLRFLPQRTIDARYATLFDYGD